MKIKFLLKTGALLTALLSLGACVAVPGDVVYESDTRTQGAYRYDQELYQNAYEDAYQAMLDDQQNAIAAQIQELNHYYVAAMEDGVLSEDERDMLEDELNSLQEMDDAIEDERYRTAVEHYQEVVRRSW
ncbi:MAG: hypothetical protein Q4G42_05745 [Neisseria sp.]|nr:hypothetical protein [Neisseria sp.]